MPAKVYRESRFTQVAPVPIRHLEWHKETGNIMAFKHKFTFCLILLHLAFGTAIADWHTSSGKEQRCPVCGMIPANYPKWRTQIIFRDGAVAAFDSPAEMFRFLGNMAKYDSKHSAADIAQMDATDYVKRGMIDARRAYYVSGSSARGPMGPDLPAFENKSDAEFLVRTAGGRVLNFDQAAKVTGNPSAR